MKKHFFILFSLLLSCQNIPSNNKIGNEKQEKVRLSFLSKQKFEKMLTEKKGYEKLSKSKSLEIMNKYKNRGSKDIIINENIKPFLEKNVLNIKGDFPTGPPDENGCIYYSYCYYVCDETTNPDGTGYCIRGHGEGCLECTTNGDNGNGDEGNGNNEDPNKELELAVSKTVFSTVIPDQPINFDVKAKSNETWNVGLKITGSSWLGEGKGDKNFSGNTTDFGSAISDGNYYFELSSLLRSNTIKKDVIVDNTKPVFSEPIITEDGNGVKFKINVKDILKNNVRAGIDENLITIDLIVPNKIVSNIKKTKLADESYDITADISNVKNKTNLTDILGQNGSIILTATDKAGNKAEFSDGKSCPDIKLDVRVPNNPNNIFSALEGGNAIFNVKTASSKCDWKISVKGKTENENDCTWSSSGIGSSSINWSGKCNNDKIMDDGTYEVSLKTKNGGSEGIIKIDNTAPEVEVTSENISNGKLNLSLNIYDPIVNGVSSGVDYETVIRNIQDVNGNNIELNFNPNNSGESGTSNKGYLEASVPRGFNIASDNDYLSSFLINDVVSKIKKTVKDKSKNNKSYDAVDVIYNQQCSNSYYKLLGVFDFHNSNSIPKGGPALTFIIAPNSKEIPPSFESGSELTFPLQPLYTQYEKNVDRVKKTSYFNSQKGNKFYIVKKECPTFSESRYGFTMNLCHNLVSKDDGTFYSPIWEFEGLLGYINYKNSGITYPKVSLTETNLQQLKNTEYFQKVTPLIKKHFGYNFIDDGEYFQKFENTYKFNNKKIFSNNMGVLIVSLELGNIYKYLSKDSKNNKDTISLELGENINEKIKLGLTLNEYKEGNKTKYDWNIKCGG